jgi:hypothetical protein
MPVTRENPRTIHIKDSPEALGNGIMNIIQKSKGTRRGKSIANRAPTSGQDSKW